MLQLINVSAKYGEMQVLWDISFTVQKGEIAAIIGANGAGKTTTLKTICGLLRASSGKIIFENEEVQHQKASCQVSKGITYVPEGRGVFPFMTVLENLRMGSYSRRARQKERENLERLFHLFPRLAERKRQLAGTLSGGEQQMLAIGRGLMADPRLIMLDEPSLGLAPKLVEEIFKKIEEISREVTVLLVEQHIQHALQLSKRGYVLENGRIAREGPSRELLKDPFVKEAYLGM